ncbi:pyridoxal-phosphate dependent enzyme [Halobaculum sp. WSA2]|uniref:Pyridoxal-phosphate dependent enzyme n=1 Tax=Halobaculum saliterrae TaxID=2073113 RepID=A0A6B0STY5_9EURY|nr:pyridoxal-phosphate dependent enzyme [Halobaculum saliterrae]MXR41086.1 pyridoxal-phosphate dependent enzyme [Halobaculum saliterrae]
MQTTDAFDGLSCTDCGESFGVDEHGRCPDCGAPLSPTYDLEAVDADALGDRDGRGAGQYRFGDLLPFPAETAITAGEGDTPLVRTDRLADELGVAAAYVKDEGRNPTGTFIDRGMSLAMTAAAERGLEPLALAAAGNAGQSAAAYAGRTDLRSYAFVPSRTAFSNKAMVNVHGGEMRVVGGRYGDAAAAVDEQLAAEYHSLQEFTTPYRHDGAKTIAYELLDALDGEDAAASLPDAVVLPASTGELVVGTVRGFEDLVDLGLAEAVPDVYAVQPAGCAPIATAFESGADAVEPWSGPDTIVGELEIEDPAGGDRALAALREADGDALTVEDDDALESAVTVAQSEVIELGAAGGVALAGAWRLAESGALGGDDEVVVVNPDAGVKAPDVLRSHLMGKGI